jgi:hypothetical protein
MGVVPLRVVPSQVSEDSITLHVVDDQGSYRAVVIVERLRRKGRVGFRAVGQERASIVECRIRDGVFEDGCFEELGRVVEEFLPGAGRALADALKEVVNRRWDELLLADRLKAEERKLREGLVPLYEEEVEGRVVRILASDGAYLSTYGSFVDLGDYVVVAESTYAYTQVETASGGIERIEPVGVAVVYRREGGVLRLADKKLYYPSIQTRLQVGDRLVRLRGESRDVKPDLVSTFPDVATLMRVVEGVPLGMGWVEVGERVVSNLKDYVVFEDDRLYDVVASYVVMTYVYDVFTAVPFLWLHGPPGSGKTRTNMTVTYMCRRGLFVADPSDATLYRMVESVGPTLGIDESILTEKGKRILAAGYKRGAVVPRAEPTKGGIVLKFFEATAPRVFSFENPPLEDYLLQRCITVSMLKARPRKFMDPLPSDFKEVRETLYYLRLTAVPQVLDARDRALKLLEDSGVWGREAEIWAPVLTAAILIGREKSVLDYLLEDVSRRRANELIYEEEKAVLAAIDSLFEETTTLTGGEKVVTFIPKDLVRRIVDRSLEEEDCVEVVEEERGGRTVEVERVKEEPRCRELEKELERKWKPQKVGLVLKNLGMDRFKKPKGKGRDVRRPYELKYSDFVSIAKRYDYEPRALTTESPVLQGGEEVSGVQSGVDSNEH